MSAEAAITTRALTKRYRDVLAVDGLELEVRPGEIYGFLGRNGAGKTTTIRMLLGLIRPTAGDATVLGRRIAPGETEVFARIGYLVETATAYPNLTVRENLDVQRRLTAAAPEATDTAIELLRLGEYADRRTATLSLGNKQRLSLARALLHEPDLLLLDEPANALDPAGIVEVRDLLRSLATERGVTVFMSSHILAEVAHLADRIGIVHEGRMLQELDREELEARESRYVEVTVSDPARAARALTDAGFAHVEPVADGMLRVLDSIGREPEIARALVDARLDLNALRPAREDLESYFLRLTGGTDVDAGTGGADDRPGAPGGD